MNVRRLKRPSPALAVAMVALFVALGGTAGAVVSATVPLAKRALVADNAKKLGGQSSAQLVSQAASQAVTQASQAPGPASTASSLVTVKTQSAGQVAPGGFREASLACDAGQKAMGGGMSSDGLVVIFDSFPASDTTWTASGGNLGSAAANLSIWVTCLR